MLDYKEHLESRLGKLKPGTVGNVFINCPFHGENSPSCSVSLKTGGFNCFGCSERGNFAKLLAEIDGISLIAANLLLYDEFDYKTTLKNIVNNLNKKDVKIVRRYISDEVFNNTFLEITEENKKYLLGRKLNEEVISKFGLRSGNFERWVDRVIFPIRNLKGNIVAFSGRHVKYNDKHLKERKEVAYDKAINDVFYGLFENQKIIKDKGYCIIVEGAMDTLYLSRFNLPVVGRLGLSDISYSQINQLLNFCNKIYLCYDGDSSGIKKTEKEFKRLDQFFFCNILNLPKEKDPNDLTQLEVNEYIISKLN